MIEKKNILRMILIRNIFFIFAIFNVFVLVYINKKSFQLNQYAEKQYQKIINMSEPRKEIFDRNNNILATNYKQISAFCIPKNIYNNKSIINYLQKEFPSCYEKIKANQQNNFIFIKRKLTDQDKDKLTSIKDVVFFIEEYSRYYPHNECAHILGTVDIDNNGIEGVELQKNTSLKSNSHRFISECDGKRNLYQNLTTDRQEKSFCQLTIDAVLQHNVTQLLEKQAKKFGSCQACAIIMKQDGQILSMAQWENDSLKENINEKKISLNNKSITHAYEMGSVIKAFCMLALLAENVVNYDEIIDCRGTKHTNLFGFPVNTWKAHGCIPFYQVIKESNNIGIAQLAHKIDKQLHTHYKKMNFGEKTNINLPGESSGFVNHPSHWSKQSILSLSYGYEISVTLLQLVYAWSLFASKGSLIKPLIFTDEEVEIKSNIYPQEIIEISRKILDMKESFYSKSYIDDLDGWQIFGKTGTANILENGHYNPERNTFSFIGHIEKENEWYVIGVHLRESEKKNLFASQVALPLFFEIASLMSRYQNKK